MIKNFQKVKLPDVSLGNLGLYNACSFYVDREPNNYPKAAFARKVSKGGFYYFQETEFYFPENCPKDYRIIEQFDTPRERLLDYAGSLKQEHANLTDDQMNHPPNFQGMKRAARWQDERRRRGLI